MKKITLWLFLVAASLQLNAQQVANYGFSQSSGTYIETSASATILASVRADSYLSDAQPIGFAFNYEGIEYTQFKMGSNGFISFNISGTSTLTGNNFSTANASSRPIIAPLWDDLDGATPASSVAAYELTGTSPNRVLTVEWRNWEWNYNSVTPVMSFQVKLYETTNVVEFVYRQEATAVNSGSASIGLGSATGSGSGSYLNVVDVTTPSVSSATSVTTISSKPADNQVYTFTPPVACTGTPVAGIATPANQNLLTGQIPVALSVTGQSTGFSGLTYQWQESTDGTTGWVNAVGGSGSTTLSYIPPAYSGTSIFYRLEVTCAASALNATSTVVSLDGCNTVTSFVENFDGVTTPNFPSCWSKIGATGLADVRSTAPNSTPNHLYIFSSSGTSIGTVAMKPLSNLGDGTHRLRFNMRGASSVNGIVEFGYLTDVSDPTTFVSLGSATATTLTYKEYIITPVAGTYSNYPAFRHTGAPANSVYIDDVKWEVIPTCIEPTALTMSNINTTTATLSWTSAEANFEYVVQTPGTGVPIATGIAVASATTVNLSSLTANSDYEVYVRTDCNGTGDGYSSWSGPINFSTACNPTNVPYVMDFESAAIPSLPNCTSQQNVGTGNLWTVEAVTEYGFTSKTLRYRWNTNNSANVWFYTQGVTLVGGTTYKMNFDYGSAGFAESLKVSYGTSSDVAAMTNLIVDYPLVNGDLLASTTDFTPTASGVYYFGFNAYSASDKFYLFVDNISVDVALSTNTFVNSSFSAYPNPVRDVLNVTYDKEISNVTVINLLGQVVLTKKVNATQSSVDMSQLNAGVYMVNVQVDGVIKTIKVIKE